MRTNPVLFLFFTVAAAAQPVDFARDVQPVFREHCFSCHGAKQQMGRFRLDRRRDAMRGGSIAVIAPGTASGSRLFHKITSTKYGPQMPPSGPLSAENISIIQRWLDQGAPWPDALANDAPATPPDPVAVRLMDALRGGRAVKIDPAAVKARGLEGNTPLHYASLYAGPATVRRLLAAGADPRAVNEAGATPLMWAVANMETLRILLEAGADPNARTADGHTALSIAAGRPGSAAIVKLLLDKGAKIQASQRVPLNEAALTSDPDLFRVLLDATPGPKTVPLGAVIRGGCKACVDLLLPAASKADLSRAVPLAARAIDPPMLASLAAKGADLLTPDPVSGNTALHAAADVESGPAPLIRELLRRGAIATAKNKAGQTPLDFAIRHGETPAIELLKQAGATAAPLAPPAGSPRPAADAREAFQRAIPLLRKADATFLKQSGCVSCHHNNLFAMVLDSARKSGLPIDDKPLAEHRRAIGAYIQSWRERAIQNFGIPGGPDTVSYMLLGLGADGYAPDAATDALAYYLRGRQRLDGSWQIGTQRPPIEVSDMQVTAASLRAILLYAPAPHKAEYRQAALRAARYLAAAKPVNNEDAAFQVLGLVWAGQSARR